MKYLKISVKSIETAIMTPACEITRGDILTGSQIVENFAGKIGGVIAHRINFPKVLAGKMSRKSCLEAKSRPLLTREETLDVKQTVAFVLTATGAMERGNLTFGDWKECFRAVRGKNCLRIDRKAKNKSEIVRLDTMTPEQVDMISALENVPALSDFRRGVIARRVKYLRACSLAAIAETPSRKSKAIRLKSVKVLRYLSSQFLATGQGTGEILNAEHCGDMSKRLWDAMKRFKKQVEDGEEILTAQSLAGVPLKKIRTLKSFASLT